MTELAEWLAACAAVLVLAWTAFQVARSVGDGPPPLVGLGTVLGGLAALCLLVLASSMPALDQPAILDDCRESGGVQMAYLDGGWQCIPAEQAG